MNRILLLNHYQPPDRAPTGRLLAELGEMLAELGWEVELIDGAAGDYQRRKGSRSLGYLLAHLRLFFRGLRARRAEVILCLTDPPCLLLTARILAKIKGARLAHWVMDLYPDLAIALGEIPKNRCSQVLGEWVANATGEADLLVALDEDMADRIGTDKIIAPWVEREMEIPPEPALLKHPDETFVWLYSGNLGRAHEWRTLLEAQAILESQELPHRLVFQGGGAGTREAEAVSREMGLQRVEFRDYAPAAEFVHSLLAASAHVVSLQPELKGMLWPSKLALLLHLPRPIFWVGTTECAPAREIAGRTDGSASIPLGDARKLAASLAKIASRKPLGSYSENRLTPEDERIRGGRLFHDWLLAICPAERQE